MKILRTLLVFDLLIRAYLVSAYNTDTCCEVAKNQHAFINSPPKFEDQTCAQVYFKSANGTVIQPAQELYVNYTYCSSECKVPIAI